MPENIFGGMRKGGERKGREGGIEKKGDLSPKPTLFKDFRYS